MNFKMQNEWKEERMKGGREYKEEKRKAEGWNRWKTGWMNEEVDNKTVRGRKMDRIWLGGWMHRWMDR